MIYQTLTKYYSVLVSICLSKSGWRKGSVEKSNDSAAQRWWRTLADGVSPPRAQAGLDQLCQDKFDARPRRRPDGEKVTVGVLAGEERLRPLPGTPYPAVMTDTRTITAQALVAWKGNWYSVPPGRPGQRAIVCHQLGTTTVDILTPAGVTLARHYREPDHAGTVVRADQHVAALEASVREARALRGAGPCHRKGRRPSSEAALAEAARITGSRAAGATVTDFAVYAAAARPLRPEPGAASGETAQS